MSYLRPENNLLIISNDYPDKNNTYTGSIFVKEQVNSIKSQFHKIFVISPIPYGLPLMRKTRYKDYSYDNVHVIFPRYFNIPVAFFVARNIWCFLESRAVMKTIMGKKISFRLIHAHFTWPSGAVAVDVKTKFNVPVIVTEHTSYTFNKAIKSKDRLFQKIWEKTDKIIRVSSVDVHLFDRVNIPGTKITSVPNGFDETKFFIRSKTKCRTMLHLPQDKKIIIYVGNFYSTIKGHIYLIKSIKRLSHNYGNFLCIIIGDGKLFHNINRLVHDIGLDSFVKLIGSKPHDELPMWLSASDFFVLPSLNEGNPTVIFEALGCGRPIIGTRVGGVPEVISSKAFGILVEPGNVDDLTSKIRAACDIQWNEDEIFKFSMQYSWNNIGKRLLEIYREVLQESSISD